MIENRLSTVVCSVCSPRAPKTEAAKGPFARNDPNKLHCNGHHRKMRHLSHIVDARREHRSQHDVSIFAQQFNALCLCFGMVQLQITSSRIFYITVQQKRI